MLALGLAFVLVSVGLFVPVNQTGLFKEKCILDNLFVSSCVLVC